MLLCRNVGSGDEGSQQPERLALWGSRQYVIFNPLFLSGYLFSKGDYIVCGHGGLARSRGRQWQRLTLRFASGGRDF